MANSDPRTAIGHLGPPSREASTPLLPSHWLRPRSKDRGDLAVHEPAMDPGVRTSPSPCLGPAPTRQSLPLARIHCWRRQADHPARTHPPVAQDDTRIEEHTTGASTLPRAATRPTLLSAWQCRTVASNWIRVRKNVAIGNQPGCDSLFENPS